MELQDLTLKQFLEETGARKILPSGGSSAALNAAMATALIEMVANLTVGKEKYEDVEERMITIADIMSENRRYFLDAIDRDANTFNEAIKAFKLPKSNELENKIRNDKIEGTMKQASIVPMELAERAYNLFDDMIEIIKNGNISAVADGMVGLLNLRTAIIGSLMNVRANIKFISDDSFKKAMQDKCELIEKNIIEKEEKTIKWIKTIL